MGTRSGLIHSAVLGGQPGSSFTPLSLTGLIAWYKADTGVTTSGGNVTQVLDQSGNGYTLTNTGTVAFNATGFNGLSAFDFIVANAGLLKTAVDSVSLSGTTGSAFFVGQMKTATANYGRAISYRGNGQTQDFSNAASAAWQLRDGTNNAIHNYRTNPKAVEAVSLATNYRLGAIYDGVNVTQYINNAAGTPAACSDSFTGPGQISVGADTLSPAYWEGPIAEVVITSSALGSGDRLSLDNYFKSHWGL